MLAVKGNKEVKILDMQKEEYLELGYIILDDKLKVIASPSKKEETRIAELEKRVKDLTKVNEELTIKNKEIEAEKKEIEKKIAELEKKTK